MTNTRLRLLEARDLQELEQLCREHAAYEKSDWEEGDRTAGLAELFLDVDDARCWVVEGDGELAGFATVSLERSTWDAARFLHLDCLYLRPGYRGQGLGEALVAEGARFAVEAGAINFQWQTPAWNEGAVRFYERIGAGMKEKKRFTMTPERCAELARKFGR